MARRAVTDKEQLQLAIRATTQFEFGSLCDFVEGLGLSDQQVASIKSKVRTHGNNIIRVVNNHLDSYSVTHRTTAPVNADRIARQLLQDKGNG